MCGRACVPGAPCSVGPAMSGAGVGAGRPEVLVSAEGCCMRGAEPAGRGCRKGWIGLSLRGTGGFAALDGGAGDVCCAVGAKFAAVAEPAAPEETSTLLLIRMPYDRWFMSWTNFRHVFRSMHDDYSTQNWKRKCLYMRKWSTWGVCSLGWDGCGRDASLLLWAGRGVPCGWSSRLQGSLGRWSCREGRLLGSWGDCCCIVQEFNWRVPRCSRCRCLCHSGCRCCCHRPLLCCLHAVDDTTLSPAQCGLRYFCSDDGLNNTSET